MSYAELHCHSYYSFHDGASSLEDLMVRAKEFGYHALAITDHDNLCGTMRFAQLAKSLEMKGIIGAELTLQLYQCFLLDMLDKLTPLPFDLHIFVAPPGKVRAMREWLNKDLPVHAQEGPDLGERMKHTFEKMFQLGYEYCVLMGSDFPDLPVGVPLEAFEGLKKHAESLEIRE